MKKFNSIYFEISKTRDQFEREAIKHSQSIYDTIIAILRNPDNYIEPGFLPKEMIVTFKSIYKIESLSSESEVRPSCYSSAKKALVPILAFDFDGLKRDSRIDLVRLIELWEMLNKDIEDLSDNLYQFAKDKYLPFRDQIDSLSRWDENNKLLPGLQPQMEHERFFKDVA